MSHKSISPIFLFLLLCSALFIFPGCDSSDVNKQSSVTSGTTSGSGSSGGAPANVSVTSASNPIASGATTIITVIITDAAGKRTDASIILTSSQGGTFNGTTTGTTNYTLNGNTLGGVLIVNYTAPSVASGLTSTDEVAATVAGTVLRGSTIITVTGPPAPVTQ